MEPESPPPPRHLADRMRRALERISVKSEADTAVPLVETLYTEVYGRASENVAAISTYVPLVAEHTHYFGGFGLLMRMPGGIAVAVGPSQSGLRLVASGADENRLEKVIRRLHEEVEGVASAGLDVAVVCATTVGDEESLLAAAGTAFLAVTGAAEEPAELAPIVGAAVEEVLGRPYGPAHVLAGLDGSPLVLVDAGTGEHVGLSRPESLGAAVLELGVDRLPGPAVFRSRTAMLETSMERLRRHGHPDLTSLRQLEHQDIPRALAVVSASARPFLRHLVTEDRRVPRMVAAVRREDAQVLGALLLMSHASRRDDADSSIDEVEFVVSLAEEAEGLYGARMSGRGYGGRVVLVGRPFLLSDIADEIARAYRANFGVEPAVSLL